MREWALVGRTDELRRVCDMLTASEAHAVVLAGPVGVGKTRLAHACLRVAADAGLSTIEVVATRSAAQLPFGAVAPLLPADPPPEPSRSPSPAPPPARPGTEAGPGPGTSTAPAGSGGFDDRVELLRRAVSALADRRDGGRLVLLVDDAHLLDDASATLVHQVAASGAAVVLATVRTGEPAPDPVVALWKDDPAARVELGPLPPEVARSLLAEVAPGPVGAATEAELLARCDGNALFLRELVLGALDDGSLTEHQGVWRLGRELTPSPRLVELVEARLRGLDERERALMETVAHGGPLGASELSAVSDPGVADALERRGLLAGGMDRRRLLVHLAHPLYADVLRAATPAVRTRGITRALAEAVEGTGLRRRNDALRVATWRLTAGGGDPGVMLAGAEVAARRFDFRLAERLACAAVDAGAGFAAELLAAHAISRQGRQEEAERRLAGLAARASDDAERGTVAIARFYNSVVYTGRDELRVLDEAEATITDPTWRERLAAGRLNVLLNTYGPGAAVEAARPILEGAEGEAIAFASAAGGYALVRAGHLREAHAAVAQGREALRKRHEARTGSGGRGGGWWYTAVDCIALAFAGRLDEAAETVEEHHDLAVRDGAIEAQALLAGTLASMVGERGRVVTAYRRAQDALALNRQLGRDVLVRQNYTHAALALGLAGRATEAAGELAAFDASDTPPVLRDEVDVLQSRAWAAAAAGDLSRAATLVRRAAEIGHEIGDRVGESRSLHGLARLGRPDEACDRLARLAVEIDGDLAPARAAHARALFERSAESLEAVSLDFEAMGADLLAAEAAADAAVARRRAGEAREAAADDQRVGILVDRCEGAATPALQATETRARLTRAERETAALAARGRSNRQIADQLFLSPRTVENRLQRVYEKLGVTGRTDLPAALAPDA